MKYKEVFFVFTLSFLFAFSAAATTDADEDRVSDDDEKMFIIQTSITPTRTATVLAIILKL